MSSDTTPAQEIDAIIAAAEGWKGATLAELRRVILSAAPDIVEEIKWRKPSRLDSASVRAVDFVEGATVDAGGLATLILGAIEVNRAG